jgi:hypothetical protein
MSNQTEAIEGAETTTEKPIRHPSIETDLLRYLGRFPVPATDVVTCMGDHSGEIKSAGGVFSKAYGYPDSVDDKKVPFLFLNLKRTQQPLVAGAVDIWETVIGKDATLLQFYRALKVDPKNLALPENRITQILFGKDLPEINKIRGVLQLPQRTVQFVTMVGPLQTEEFPEEEETTTGPENEIDFKKISPVTVPSLFHYAFTKKGSPRFGVNAFDEQNKAFANFVSKETWPGGNLRRFVTNAID